MKPFSDINNVATLSEKELIARVCRKFGSATQLPSPYGAGDDCAVINSASLQKNVCATSDAVILGRHFSYTDSPFLAGEKLIKRNVSDIASMGATPFSALASSICSPNISLDWLDAFSEGMGVAAQRYGIKIIGGDFASVKEDFFSTHLTLLGHTNHSPMLRTGASEGDIICTTGVLGASFESGHHLTFEPRVAEGQFLIESGLITACTDLSDGMGSDIRNVLPKGMCAEFNQADIPLREYDGKTASLKGAFCDGEDYELLFTFSANGDFDKFASEYFARFGSPIYRIGTIKKASSSEEENALILVSNENRAILNFSGFDHYQL